MSGEKTLDPRRVAALRGATWNGRRCLTLRRADGTVTGSAAAASSRNGGGSAASDTPLVIGAEAATSGAIAAAYRSHLDRKGVHPAGVELDGVLFLLAPAADAPVSKVRTFLRYVETTRLSLRSNREATS
jgi:hypothetical protein